MPDIVIAIFFVLLPYILIHDRIERKNNHKFIPKWKVKKK